MTIGSIEALEALYGTPIPSSVEKVSGTLTGAYARWIAASRFCVLATVGPEGTDASPRGDVGPVAAILDPSRLAIPDWRGNNRLDSLRNIVRDGRVSLMFMVPGSTSVVRVNGAAVLKTDADLVSRFEVKKRHPTCVIVVTVAEVYMQCAKALLRSELWAEGDRSSEVPTAGEMLSEATANRHGGSDYDRDYAARAEERMW